MSLDKSEVEKIAWLARLETNDQENTVFSEELSSILDLVEQMDAADTSQVSAIAHPLDMVTRLRADAVTETDQRERFQQHAPLTEDGYYLVPKVIE